MTPRNRGIWWIGRLRAAAVGALAAILLTGCARTMVAQPLDTSYPPGNVDREMAFWRALPEKGAVSNDEGLHGLILFADGTDRSRVYASRVDLAKSRGWLGSEFDEPADMAMQRGTLARIVAIIAGVKGGVMMHLLGPTPRYATRELAYQGIMAGGTELQAISGLEYTGVLSKAQDYMVRHGRTPGGG